MSALLQALDQIDALRVQCAELESELELMQIVRGRLTEERQKVEAERDEARERLRSEGSAMREDITALVARAEKAEEQLRAVDPLLSATEELLAELGVTEPGAGEDNHEMPVAGLMDKLYEAWNEIMRARHGQPDAIFEPEGL